MDLPRHRRVWCSLQDSGQQHLHSQLNSFRYQPLAFTEGLMCPDPHFSLNWSIPHIYLNLSQMATYIYCPVGFLSHGPYYRRVYSSCSWLLMCLQVMSVFYITLLLYTNCSYSLCFVWSHVSISLRAHPVKLISDVRTLLCQHLGLYQGHCSATNIVFIYVH